MASRNRGAVDLDPTEGLPVQKWEKVSVRVNQDPSADSSAPTNVSATSSAEWAAQFNTPQFPFSEPALPSFFTQLSPMNQEMIRRARAGNTNVKPSVWDNKAGCYISSAEADKRQNALKSVHLNNLDHTSTTNNITDDTAQNDDDDDNDDGEDDGTGDDNEDDGPVRNTPGPKRRKHTAPEDRAFEVKRWQQVPLAVAEKIEERRFLADRRPGMPSLYGGAYQAQIFGSMGLTQNGYNGNGISGTSYDLGDGSGLGNAIGANGNDQGTATPVRRNMPPKRKKKKGGPGRRKANQTTQADGAGSNVPVSTGVAGQDVSNISQTDGANDRKEDENTNTQDGDGDNDGSGSDDSEGEGSEEGEIDEGKGDDGDKISTQEQAKTQEPTITTTSAVITDLPTSTPLSVPEPTPVSIPVPEILISDHVAVTGTTTDIDPLPTISLSDTVPETIQISTPEPSEPITEPVPEPNPVAEQPPTTTSNLESNVESNVSADADIDAGIDNVKNTAATTTETNTASTNTNTNVPEIDLLGGLEDQLDRDMQE